MNREEARAVRDFTKRQVEQYQAAAPPTRVVMPPQITNEIEVAPLDLTPMAEAVDRMTKTLAEAVDRMADALAEQAGQIGELLAVLRDQEPPTVEVNPTIEIPKGPAPQVTVEAAKVPERKKRKIRVSHSDGSESTIEEE